LDYIEIEIKWAMVGWSVQSIGRIGWLGLYVLNLIRVQGVIADISSSVLRWLRVTRD
jgi:hypothetical protein